MAVIVPERPGALDRPMSAEDPMGLFKLAIESKAGADTLERVMAVRRELKAEAAKEAFDRAMAAFQSECPIIEKKKFGAKNAYKYAPLDQILVQVKDLIRAHGFCFTLTSDIEQGWVKAICKVTHEAGHSVPSEFKAPIDMKNPMMTDPQRYGGAMTFAKRYAFCNAFGILTADEDLDGANRPKPAGPSSLAGESDVRQLTVEVWNLLANVRGTEKNWHAANQWLWKHDLLDGGAEEACPHLSPARYRELIAKLKGHPEL